MWTEEHRPQTLDDIIGQQHIVSRLQFMVNDLRSTGNDGAFPHMLFAGPAGVGKTATAVALMRSMFGDEWQSNWLELNASDDRSINTVRSKIKEFASKGVIGSYLVDGKPQKIPFNMIFLDEADHLTSDAQAALRRTMERYSKHTRFILSCNYPHRLIEPLRDRCAFSDTRFTPVSAQDMKKAMKAVIESKTIEIDDDALDCLIGHSNGSMRKALNLLFTVTRQVKHVEIEDVDEVAKSLTPKMRNKLLGMAIKANEGTDEEHRSAHRAIDKYLENLHSQGFSSAEILDNIYRSVADDDKMPASLQRAILTNLGEALYWASVSSDDLLAIKTFFRRVTA